MTGTTNETEPKKQDFTVYYEGSDNICVRYSVYSRRVRGCCADVYVSHRDPSHIQLLSRLLPGYTGGVTTGQMAQAVREHIREQNLRRKAAAMA